MRTSRPGDEPIQVRFLRIFIIGALAALPLLGVTPSSLVALPTVVVFPFTLNASDVDKESGSRLSVIVATGIANNGGVVLKPAPPGTERKNYLTVARQLGADYYVSGYITPLGNEVSVVEQVVSTQSGILVASNTAQLSTYADAAGQGATLGDEIIHHHNRNLDAFTAPPPPPAATPTPEATGAAQADIGHLFKRKGKAGPTATPAASAPPATVAAAGTPSPGIAANVNPGSSLGLISFGGSASEALRNAARTALATDLAGAKIATVTEDGTTCSSGVTRLTNGTLAVTEATTRGQTVYTATVNITVTDCSGKVLLKETYGRDAGQDIVAVDGAVADAANAIANPPRRRHLF